MINFVKIDMSMRKKLTPSLGIGFHVINWKVKKRKIKLIRILNNLFLYIFYCLLTQIVYLNPKNLYLMS
jgi:hypothetical protein